MTSFKLMYCLLFMTIINILMNIFINSIIKELYFSGASFSALGLANEKEVIILKGAISGGKYKIGLVIGSDASYCREYNTLEELVTSYYLDCLIGK